MKVFRSIVLLGLLLLVSCGGGSYGPEYYKKEILIVTYDTATCYIYPSTGSLSCVAK